MMNKFRPLLLAAILLPMAASAQYQWLDAQGRKVFSDQPPPASVPAARIVRQPAARAATTETASAAPTAAGGTGSMEAGAKAAASAPKLSGKDKELEDKRKAAETAEAEKKKAEEAKMAAAKAENCTRTKGAKATFDSGQRVARINSKGEREYFTDQERDSETKRLQAIIDRDCKTVQ